MDAVSIAHTWFRGLNERRVADVSHLLAEDVTSLWPGNDVAFGPNAVLGFVAGFYDSFPDIHYQVDTVIGSGAAALIEGVMIGTTHSETETKEGERLPPGRNIHLPFCTVIHTRGRKVVAYRTYYDRVDIVEQMRRSYEAS